VTELIKLMVVTGFPVCYFEAGLTGLNPSLESGRFAVVWRVAGGAPWPGDRQDDWLGLPDPEKVEI
jgi:hypothetical protein